MATDGRLEIYKEIRFPNLAITGYRVTSPATQIYNCFAWAAAEENRWWNPLEPDNPYYWVDGVPNELTISAFILAYGTMGYEPCTDAIFEVGFEKIALYALPDGEITHAARQLPNGKWTSKLGRWEDIEHELDGLVGEMYGSVKQILKRLTKAPQYLEEAEFPPQHP
jgi:hypothetical protein